MTEGTTRVVFAAAPAGVQDPPAGGPAGCVTGDWLSAASRIGLGLAALGRPAYITTGRERDLGADRSVSAMERRCHELLDAAYAAGVRYLDAARSYGLAEQFLSTWLETRRPPEGSLAVGSKWGYTYVGSWRMDAAVHEIKNLSLETLRTQLAESRRLLGRWLRLYQIHSATAESGVLEDHGVLAELARLRAEGIAVGLTTTGPPQADTIRRALAANVDGINPFETVQSTWNLLETSAEPALQEAHERGWRVIVKEVLANGRLAGLSQTAFAAALSKPWVDVVLSGAVTVQQLQENVHALRAASTYVAQPPVAEDPVAYWEHRRRLQWE